MRKYHTLFCDMDGVLVDFTNPAVTACNKAWKEGRISDSLSRRLEKELQRNYVWAGDMEYAGPPSIHILINVVLKNDYDFWATLPFMTDGRKLWSAIKDRATILSKPMLGEGCVKGKIKWIQENLALPSDRIILERKKDKYAVTSDMPNLLIDDYDKNVSAFRAAGGLAILHRNIKTTLRELADYSAI